MTRRPVHRVSPEYHTAIEALKTRGLAEPTLITISGTARQALADGAQQLTKGVGRSLYRIDLSQIVSKYIGETEKNLDRVLGEAQAAGSVLLIEDGDSLFGRGSASSEGTSQPGNGLNELVWQRLASYRGVTIALVGQPVPPVAPRRRVRHIHLKFPPAQ